VEQFITFRVARQDFAMESARVCGLLPMHELIPVETAQSWISGIASLKGREFPVIDLRGKLGIAHGSHGRQPCVVVVELEGSRLLGFVADRISEVVTPRQRDFNDGRLRVNGRMRRLLNPDQILTEEELQSFWKLTLIP
jgi:chemotaxis signal transduction protein